MQLCNDRRAIRGQGWSLRRVAIMLVAKQADALAIEQPSTPYRIAGVDVRRRENRGSLQRISLADSQPDQQAGQDQSPP
jgi:hypothetical protein